MGNNNRINKLFLFLSQQNIFKHYLVLFRIFISFHILKKVYINWGLHSVLMEIYQKESITKDSFFFELITYNNTPLFVYFIVILSILYIFGIGGFVTKSLLFYFFIYLTKFYFGFTNGGDNLLQFILFYLIFCNTNYKFSITNYRDSELLNFISNIGVYCILIHLCLIYFISAIHKIHSDVWFNGVATYYILNLERFSSPLCDYVSKNSLFIAVSTYSTIFFELLFPFLIWFKQTKKVFIFWGITVHIGIYFFMMIYDFEILFMMIYGFFISNDFYEEKLNKLVNLTKKLNKFQL